MDLDTFLSTLLPHEHSFYPCIIEESMFTVKFTFGDGRTEVHYDLTSSELHEHVTYHWEVWDRSDFLYTYYHPVKMEVSV